MKNLKICYLATIIFCLSCNSDDGNSNNNTNNSTTPSENTPNVLLIIADDLGKDAIIGYSEGTIKPNTPNLDAIRNSGLMFNNFWAYPTCSPTRASIITGKYGYSTGVKWANDVLSTNETAIQQYINDNTNDAYATAIVGKWHLSGPNTSFNPELFGIDYYAGLITGGTPNYYNWSLTENGTSNNVTEYATTKFTDLAIDWINDQSKPWFMWLAYNAPHTPFHVPPNQMHSQGNLAPYNNGMDATPYYMAAIEAMDFEIGRLLNSIPQEERENTTIIFIGDNGTPNQVAQVPYSSTTAKGTLYQGGINTPLFVSGMTVSRSGTDDNLITSTDLFATIAEVAGVSVNEINDSKSFETLFSSSSTIRGFQYAEMNDGTDNIWTISDGNYKLFENANGNKEFYFLINDPYEQNNLLDGTLNGAETAVKLELETELAAIRQ